MRVISREYLSFLTMQSVADLFEQMSDVERLRQEVYMFCNVGLQDAQVLTEDDCEWILKYYRGAA